MSIILLFRRIIRHVCLGLTCVALLLVSGCSTLKLVYNQSDDLLYWWVDGYADLQDEQKPFVRNTLSDLQKWHRQQQLPEYMVLLQDIRTLAPNDITPQQVCVMTEKMKTSFITLLRHVEPASTQLVMQLNADQLKSIRKRYDKTNKDWREDWLEGSDEKRVRYRFKQALNRLEDFYGRLDAPQREVLQQWLSGSSFDARMSYAERERRQADSLQTMQRMAQMGTANANTQSQLRAWVDRAFQSPNERYLAYSQTLTQENCEGFAKLHNSTTPAQRQRFAETLKGYETDLRILMAQKK
jgi:hypothetical protein